MSLLSNVTNLFKKELNTGIFGFFNSSAIPKMSEKEFLKAYRGWVFACTNAIAQRVADTELILQRKDKNGEWKDFTGDNEAMDLLRNVNDHMSYYDLAFGYSAFQELDGNSFWYMPKNAGGKITELWPLDPSRTQVVKSKDNFIAGYVFLNEVGIKVPFAPEEILHFKRFNSKSAYRGMGTVEAAAIAIDTDTFAAEWQRNFFGNSAMPSAVLSSVGTLNQEQYDRIKANWDSKFKGVENAHKMAIMEGGMSYTPINPTNRDMQFSQGRKDLRDEICGIFGVPLPVLGILDTANLASADAADMLFAKNTVKPKLTQYAGNLTEFYLPRFNLSQKQWRIWFVDPVPENREQKRLDRESGIKNYYMTPNEARAEIGKEPVEGGDFLYIPTLYQPTSASNADGSPTPPANSGKGFILLPLKSAVASKKKELAVKQIKDNRSKIVDAAIPKLTKKNKALNDKLESMLLANLRKSKNKKPVNVKRTLLQILKDATDPSNEMVKLLFTDYEDWIGLLHNATEEGMSTVFEQAGKVGISQVNADVTFDMQNPRALDFLNEHVMENTDSYAATMKEDISLKVMEGVEEGESVDDIATTIGAFFEDQGDYRAERLARTETIDAYAQGNLEGYKQSGIVSGKSWLFDEGSCSSGECPSNADQGVIPLDEDFESGDDAPPGHPNCECALQPETGEIGD
ncbi:MAG TPA: phage portal protein [Methylomirabilota bacterium]|nr:phage portal protein [Methylomirabilota bacterium]